MLFEFFLGTGLRDQEVMFTTWKNIDFKGKTFGSGPDPNGDSRLRTGKSVRSLYLTPS